jgi:hypothetical protein
MASKKARIKITNRERRYQELSLLIFRGLDNANRDKFAYAENKPVSEKRRELIDRFIQRDPDLLNSLRKASAKTVRARARVDALLRGDIEVLRRNSSRSTPTSSDPKWSLPEEELREIEETECKPRYIVDHFARCVYAEGQLVGELWARIGEAVHRSIAKTDKPPRNRASKVERQQSIIFPFLTDFLTRKKRKKPYKDPELAQVLLRERGSELGIKPGVSTSTLERRVAEFRAARPDLLPPAKAVAKKPISR